MKRRSLNLNEAKSLGSFYSLMPVALIEKAIGDGKIVELVESTFEDPNDFCSVMVDGRVVFHANGF